MIKKGDTLIEVTIAVGIFSMIAIAVTSVMSSGTSDAQTALETTLAREEIDAQAEALRFIQASYIADKGIEGNSKYPELWKKITESALENPSSAVLQYAPTSCQELYDTTNENNITKQHAFILNTRKLGNFTSTDDVLVSAANDTGNKKIFNSASIYPRLIYNGEDNQALINSGTITNLSRAEGIYIVAVRDNETTKTVDATGAVKNSAFYDFYIRTCWYGSNANEPSTISTVIRLHDPDVIAERPGVFLYYSPNGGEYNKNYNGNIDNPTFIPNGQSITLPTDSKNWFTYNNKVNSELASFVCWSTNSLATKKNCDDGSAPSIYKPGNTFSVTTTAAKKKNVTLYAIWNITRIWVDANIVLNGTPNTSGDEHLKVKSYIDGNYIDESNNDFPIVDEGGETNVVINDHDFYQPVDPGSEVRIELYNADGYRLLSNESSLCQPIQPNVCHATTFENPDGTSGTAVEFTVTEVPQGVQINSTGRRAVNIVSEWETTQ